MEAFNPIVLVRPRTHAERIPALPPALLFLRYGARPQFACPPDDCLARQAADHGCGSPAWHLGLAKAHAQPAALGIGIGFVVLVRPGVGVGAGRLGDRQGELVAGGLFGRHDQ